ncbi:MAG: TolC family protein, partial [Candidatus Omnitrophica bacterium]|nr:TolC family protein [Candidatus Omnitrophota bacterium]
MLKKILFATTVLFTLLLASHIFCQEIQKAPILYMSIDDTVEIAFKNNKQIQIQEREIRVARANILEAQSRFLPKLNMDGSYTYNDAVIEVNAAALGKTEKDIGVSAGYKNDNKYGFSLTETLFKGGANIANWNQANIGFIIQQVSLQSVKLDVEFEAKRLYYGLLLAYETERIVQNLLTQAQAHYMNVKNKFEQGRSSRFDLLQSKIQVSKIVPGLVRATNSVDLIKADLKKLLSINIMTLIEPVDSLEYNPLEINEESFLKEAYAKRPEIILKELGVDIDRWSIEKAKAGYIPDIDASASYYYR